MKRILTVCALLFTLAASAQSGLRAGAKGSAFKSASGKGIDMAYGGEAVVTFSIKKLNLGTGAEVLYFENLADVAVPAYLTVGYDFTPQWSAHIDGGQVLYGRTVKGVRTSGNLYAGAGVRYNLGRLFYAGAQYSLYGFKVKGFDPTYTHGGSLSFGVRLKG